MIPSAVFSGFRELRIHLMTGSLSLFLAWLWFGDRRFDEAGLGDLARRLGLLSTSLGPTTRASLFTFAALMVGGFVDRLTRSLIIPRLSALFGELDWHALSSLHAVDQDELEAVNRHRGEANFRLSLFWVSIVGSLCFAINVRGPWWAVMLIPAFVWFDWITVQNAAVIELESARVQDVRSSSKRREGLIRDVSARKREFEEATRNIESLRNTINEETETARRISRGPGAQSSNVMDNREKYKSDGAALRELQFRVQEAESAVTAETEEHDRLSQRHDTIRGARMSFVPLLGLSRNLYEGSPPDQPTG